MAVTITCRFLSTLLVLSAVVFSAPQNVFDILRPQIRSYKQDDVHVTRSARLAMPLLKSMRFIGKFSYTLGQRIVGDRILSQTEGGENFPTAKNVEIILRYPEAGTGSTLTYVSILVDQTTSVGGAYLVDGGISEKYIKLLVVANSTTKFLYSAVFYGY